MLTTNLTAFISIPPYSLPLNLSPPTHLASLTLISFRLNDGKEKFNERIRGTMAV
jgi:hypothetical protein